MPVAESKSSENKALDSYEIEITNLVTKIDIFWEKGKFVPSYRLSISNISPTTKILLEKIRKEFISQVALGIHEFSGEADINMIKKKFEAEIKILINRYLSNVDEDTMNLLMNYVIRQNLGLGDIEILLRDANLEEIVINNAKEPVWVYHKKFGWLKTNVILENESKIRHYSTMIGRDVNKEITLLNPLMDAHLLTGDRVNATLNPISDKGNTITIRKFAEKPWTITDLINAKTMNYKVAAIVWLAIQNELSILIAGGTGSGKTSTLNVISNFFPPNQRIISIEDTREITLSKTLHWVPMATRLPNPEGKGGVAMLDLVVNSLRQRPDRILVGEIRRKEEAEVLFEAVHTGHSVYATIHANNAQETFDRLTNPPIDLPKNVLGALDLILVQNRNRRTGRRRTLQVSELRATGEPNVFFQLDVMKDDILQVGSMDRVTEKLKMYTGMGPEDIEKDLAGKIKILKWLVANKINDVHQIGWVMAMYYTDRLGEIEKLDPGMLEKI